MPVPLTDVSNSVAILFQIHYDICIQKNMKLVTGSVNLSCKFNDSNSCCLAGYMRVHISMIVEELQCIIFSIFTEATQGSVLHEIWCRNSSQFLWSIYVLQFCNRHSHWIEKLLLTAQCNTAALPVITFLVSRRWREMYIGHARMCVSVPRHILTLLHRPRCNLGEW